MCGISGFIAFTTIKAKHIELMNNQIKHRGPDDEGYLLEFANNIQVLGGNDTNYTNNELHYTPKDNINQHLDQDVHIAFGHRRLSIVDLSPLGHQPLCIDNSNYWITYNGEVYNHIELRLELEQLGHIFLSHSDTEVILHAYQEWGALCLDKFNGMFAFLIYDKTQQQVFIARDRFGVKPLYYYQDNTGIFFASEIKQFTVLPNWQAKLNHQRAYDFLAHGLTDHLDETLFLNVKQLSGGEYAIIDLSNFNKDTVFTKTRWYTLKDNNYSDSYEQACIDFRELFIDAVRLRLRADVDIGSCLSGGLDSSAIVCTMNLLLKEQGKQELQATFSACSHYKEFDESEYIHEVVNKTNANAHYCYPELEQLFNVNEKLTWHQDEPFASTSIYAQWSVFELASKNQVKVLLDGQGADEQLAGYQGLYFQIYLNELLHKGNILGLINEANTLNQIHGFNIKNGILKSIMSLLPNQAKNIVGKFMGKAQYKTNWIDTQNLKFNDTNPFVASGMDKKSIKNTSYSQLILSNLPMLLHFEDRDSMAHSIESRVPFIDYRLVELVYSMPSEYKIKHGITKRVLRDGLNGILPNKIKNRMSKLGFVTPEEIWLKKNPEIFKQKLLEAIDASGGILNQAITLQIFDEIIAGRRSFDFWLWRVISFGTWMKLFKVSI